MKKAFPRFVQGKTNACFAALDDLSKPLILYLPPPATSTEMQRNANEALQVIRKGFKKELLEFGESVLYMKPMTAGKNKFEIWLLGS